MEESLAENLKKQEPLFAFSCHFKTSLKWADSVNVGVLLGILLS